MKTETDSTGEPVEDPQDSAPYLDAITQAEKAFSSWNAKADNIDKLYSDLEKLSNPNRDRQMAIFWANIQVLGPSIYSRPPIPVVTPRFSDRDILKSKASEALERATIVTFEMEDIDEVMRQIRDDMNLPGRGAPWIRLETRGGKDYCCIEHVDRKDFLHEPARKWKEVGWVSRRGWLTKAELKERFKGDAWQNASYNVQKDAKDKGAADDAERAGVWEIWHKTEKKVIWVTEGVDTVLEKADPHLKLEGFFPCPKPAYTTVQRGSLIPVPDVVYYMDQIEEINDLTNRIGALSLAVKVRGFYAAGASEVGTAIESALKMNSDSQIMVPVPSLAAFGSGGEVIIWLPIDQIVQTIAALVELRQQLITDVYEITGLSDIMRGSTDANETLGAQQLKSQYGSVRVKDKQHALIRVARDITRLVAEVIAENYSPEMLMEIGQMELPSDADIQQQGEQIVAQAEQMVIQGKAQLDQAMQQAQDPQAQQQMQQKAQQMLQQLQEKTQKQLSELEGQPTVEKVVGLLREQRLRPFILEIETDSTIQPDENAEKQRRAEFMAALGSTLQQLAPMVAAQPETAKFAGDILKFAVAPFRAGRELEASIDEFVDQMKQRAGQPQPPNPEAEKAKADMAAKQQDLQANQQMAKAKHEAEMQIKGLELQGKQAENKAKIMQVAAKAELDEKQHLQAMDKGSIELEKARIDLARVEAQSKADAQKAFITGLQADHDAELKERAHEREAAKSKSSEAG